MNYEPSGSENAGFRGFGRLSAAGDAYAPPFVLDMALVEFRNTVAMSKPGDAVAMIYQFAAGMLAAYDKLDAAKHRVLELHQQAVDDAYDPETGEESPVLAGYCAECVRGTWPCPTVRAVMDILE